MNFQDHLSILGNLKKSSPKMAIAYLQDALTEDDLSLQLINNLQVELLKFYQDDNQKINENLKEIIPSKLTIEQGEIFIVQVMESLIKLTKTSKMEILIEILPTLLNLKSNLEESDLNKAPKITKIIEDLKAELGLISTPEIEEDRRNLMELRQLLESKGAILHDMEIRYFSLVYRGIYLGSKKNVRNFRN